MGRVLILEDDPDITEVYRAVLSDRGHLIVGIHADPQESFLDSDRIRPIDLVIVDERLGTLSGSSFVPHIRLVFPEAKLLMVTADPEAIARGGSTQIDAALRKPITLGRLMDVVERLLTGP